MARVRKKKSADVKAFFEFLQELALEKQLSIEKLLEVVKASFLIPFQKKYGLGVDLKVVLDSSKKEVEIIHRRLVAEKVLPGENKISFEEAIKKNPEIKIGEIFEESYDPFEFSRVHATNIRQVLIQKLGDLEREVIYAEYKDKVGDLINGYFLRWRDREIVYVDLGRTEGILPRREQIPGERFRSGDRVKALIKSIELKRERSRETGPFIILSRAAPEFVRKLFEMEIPEIYDGVVEVVRIVRQAGYRTKLMVKSTKQDVDPVGACVGIKGVRIQAIVRELGNERIDIVNYTQEPQALIANALSPADVVEVRVDVTSKEAFVVVTDNSYSVAIGNTGHNVRLACQLTGYNIVVKSQTQFNKDMSSPEAKERLEAIFRNQITAMKDEPEEVGTSLNELTGLSKRIILILKENGIRNVEELLEVSEDDLATFPGVGRSTAKQIRSVLMEAVEFEEA